MALSKRCYLRACKLDKKSQDVSDETASANHIFWIIPYLNILWNLPTHTLEIVSHTPWLASAIHWLSSVQAKRKQNKIEPLVVLLILNFRKVQLTNAYFVYGVTDTFISITSTMIIIGAHWKEIKIVLSQKIQQK